MNIEEKTEPKLRFPKDYDVDPATLAAGRYGTKEMVEIWGAEKTFEYSLKVQGQAALTLSKLHPDVVPKELAEEIAGKASLEHIDPNRIRYLEAQGDHDIIALNKALEEQVSPEAGAHINKAKTSADTTQPAKALQLKASLEVIADTAENLRDIVIEKSLEWIDVPHMDTSHLYDALPTVAGRPLAHYAEMLQSSLEFLKFVYDNSIMGKWGDATGNHHSAKLLGIDGIDLQKEYCEDLGVGYMDAPAQVPGVEFEADVTYALARLSETVNNLSKYIAWGRSSDVFIFVNGKPKKAKGSSAMPHKDIHRGNPIVEEQNMSERNYMMGNLVTALMNCELPYARNLAASANSRINNEDGFKFMDHCLRRLSDVTYWLELREERCKERVSRSYGTVTSQAVMNYLTDSRKLEKPLTRSEAHDLMGRLATCAWKNKRPLEYVCVEDKEFRDMIKDRGADLAEIYKLIDPEKYIGESKRIIELVAEKYYKKKTLT
jgi:adenylosuccinate lyase